MTSTDSETTPVTHEGEPVPSRPPGKLLAPVFVKVQVAIVSGLVLTAGILFAPQPTPSTLSTPEERVAPLLEEQVQTRTVTLPFRGVQDVAERVREHSVAIPALPRELPQVLDDFSEAPRPSATAGFGVFVSNTRILTHAAALHGRSTLQVVSRDSRLLQTTLAAHDPTTGLVLLTIEPSGVSAPPLADAPPARGMLAVGVGIDRATPVFVTSLRGDSYEISGVDTVLPGTPIYTVEGHLLAIAGTDGRALPAAASVKQLLGRESSRVRPGSIGIAYQGLSDGLTRIFGASGVIVTDVLEGGPAHTAGVQVGDVLLAVSDVTIASAEDVRRAIEALEIGSTASLRASRDGRAVVLQVIPTSVYGVVALARNRPATGTAGIEASAVLAASVLARAGIPGTARVIRIDGRPIASRAQADRELRRARPRALLLLEQNTTRFFAAVEAVP